MLWTRHAVSLFAEVARYTFVNRAWWLIPTIFILMLVVLVIAVGHAASTYTLYTVF